MVQVKRKLRCGRAREGRDSTATQDKVTHLISIESFYIRALVNKLVRPGEMCGLGRGDTRECVTTGYTRLQPGNPVTVLSG